MPLNPYFNNFGYTPEQDLHEQMVVESIQMFGMQVLYLPRNIQTRDAILREGDIVTYETTIPITVLFKTTDGWGDAGNFLSKFGPEIRNSCVLTAAMQSFRTETTQFRPLEGDLVYLPMNGKLFSIQFVNHEQQFYENGRLYSWDIPCTLFEYSSEVFSTGNPAIDDKYNAYSLDLTQSHIEDTSNNDIMSEIGGFFQDESYQLPDSNSQNDAFDTVAKPVINNSERDPFGFE